jgi:hypothetical protein
MRFKQLVLLVLILCLALGMAFAQSRADQDAPKKGQRLPAPFAMHALQREGNLVSSTMIFEEDFDPAPGSWMIGNGWFIGQDPLNGAVSGLNNAYTLNPYEDFANYELISPQIILPAATELGTRYELKLWHWWDVESSYDYVYIDVLIGGQLETTLLTQTGYQAWTENNLDLTAFAGQTIQLRFRLVADGSGNYAGFGIDDIEIWKNVFEYEPEMDLLSLNAQNFPFIYSTLSLGMEGEDLSDLDETNFQVYENDVLQTSFFSVTPPSTGAGSRLVDIAFQMDNSGSMSSSIAAVSANVTAFINNLSGSGVDSALGLCRYGQSANGGNPILEDSGILTTNLDYFRDNVWARNRIDGGHEPGYYAINQSLSGFNWRPGSQKVLIIITDETPDQGGASLQNAIDASVANGAILFALTYSGLYSTFTPITEATGGAVYDINSNFDDILAHISQIIVSNYIISYRSSNPYYDGTLRNLRYVMNYENVTAEEVGSYFPGQAPQIVRSPATMIYDNQAQLDNQDIPIDVIISDTYAPFTSNATLYYRNFDQSVYTPLAMQNTGGDLWSATIPAYDVQAPGIAYYFSASDGQSTSTLPSSEPANNPFTVAVLPNLPPVVTHFPQMQTNYYTPLNISANIFDDTDYVEDVVLAYRRYGQLSYTQVPMTDMEDGVFNAQIPGEIVGNTGVEYFIRAWDNFGLVGASGYADNPHYVAALLDGTIIPGGEASELWWPAANSPYYLSGSVYVNSEDTLIIEPGSSLIFAPGSGLEIQGGLTADNVSFNAQNPYMGWNGIWINNAPGPVMILNCEINHAVVGVTFTNSSGDLLNITISKDRENNSFTGEAGVSIQGNSSPIIDGVNIHNYTPGILIQNTDTIGSNPSIVNVFMHGSYDLTRTATAGLHVEGNVSLSLDELDIIDFDDGISWEGDTAPALRNTALLSNIRVRNSSSSSRTPGKALNFKNLSSLQGTNIDISGYPQGMDIDNQDLVSNANVLLTNIRIRNSASSSRSGDYGLKIGPNVALILEEAVIDSFSVGIDMAYDAEQPSRNTTLLTNIRVRNSSSSSRSFAHGIKAKNIYALEAEDINIIGYQTGMEIDNQEMTDTGSALLTDFKVLKSDRQGLVGDYGIKIGDNISPQLVDVVIDNYLTGLQILASPDSHSRNTVLLENVTVYSSASSDSSQGIIMQNIAGLQADSLHVTGYASGVRLDNQGMLNSVNIDMHRITVDNFGMSHSQDDAAVSILGPLAATIDSMNIFDYYTGLHYEGSQQIALRTTPLLTNIRVRNSASTSRNESKGLVLKNLAAVDILKCIIYADVSDSLHVNSLGSGIDADSVNGLNMFQSTIWGYENGVRLSNSSNASFNRSIIWKNTPNDEEMAEPIWLDISSNVTAANSAISYANGVYPGVGNIDRNPLFADPHSGNFYLKPRSVLHDDDPDLVIGALPFDFNKIAKPHVKTFEPGWNMKGVPYYLEPGHTSPSQVFGSNLAPFYVSPYYTSILQLNPNAMPDTLGYIVFTTAPAYSVPSIIRPGVGYWVRNPNSHQVDVTVYGLMDDGDYLMITPGVFNPQQGHFMLSNPYDKPIKLNNGITISDDMHSAVFIYNHTDYSLDALDLNEGIEIPAWASFIVKANSPNDWVKMTYPQSPSRTETNLSPTTIVSAGLEQASPPRPEWELYINATCDDHSAVVVLGVAEDAENSYDAMDVPAVPFNPFRNITLKINNLDWEENAAMYTRDIRSNQRVNHTWDLSLNLQDILAEGHFAGQLRLSMNSAYKLPPNYSYMLIDARNGNRVDLLTEALILDLEIDLNNPEAGLTSYIIPLQVVVQNLSDENEEELDSFSSSSYPNPFNPSTTISYNLPSDSRVSINIYNVKGQRVRQLLSADQKLGSHSLIWNGKDSKGNNCSSGFYFYRIQAGENTITKKILMLK